MIVQLQVGPILYLRAHFLPAYKYHSSAVIVILITIFKVVAIILSSTYFMPSSQLNALPALFL